MQGYHSDIDPIPLGENVYWRLFEGQYGDQMRSSQEEQVNVYFHTLIVMTVYCQPYCSDRMWRSAIIMYPLTAGMISTLSQPLPLGDEPSDIPYERNHPRTSETYFDNATARRLYVQRTNPQPFDS